MKTAYQRSLACALGSAALTLALAACGPAPAPSGTGTERQFDMASSATRAVVQYEDELADLTNYPEPAPTLAGGIPPEDLTATPKNGGLLRIGLSGLNDPHWTCCATGGQHRIYGMGLLRWDLRCNCPQPDLAESWTVGKDGLSYDFKIRKGVKFQNLPPVNGREVTIQDIKWSLDRVSGLRETPGKQAVFASRFVNVKEFQIVNDGTLRMVMKQPDVQIMADIMYDYFVVMPKEAEIDGSFDQAKAIIGSGPFQVEYGEPGGSWMLKKNPTYWEKDKAGRQLPYLNGVNIVVVADNAARIAGFKSQQLDMVPIVYAAGRPLLGDPNVRYSYQRGLAVGAIGFFMNTAIPPFNDVRMRRAINLTLNRDEFIQAVYGDHDAGYVTGPLGTLQPWHWSEAKMWTLPGYAKGEAKKKELEEAKKLMAEAGYPNGLDIMVTMQTNEWFEILQAQLKRAGITSRHEEDGAGSKYASTTREMGRQLFQVQQGGGHVPDTAWSGAWLCGAVQNVSLYCNPELDTIWAEFRRTRESDKRLAMMQKAQEVLWEDMPMAPGIRQNVIHAGYKYVRGYRNSWYDLQWSQNYQMAYTWLDK